MPEMTPAYAIDWIKHHKPLDTRTQDGKAMSMAVYALSRLIPVRPFEDGQGGYICNTVNCNTYLDKFAPYCPMCGKPICWKEGE